MSNAFKLAMVYVGIVVGAGFASGQEILSFFVVYGDKSYLGIIFSALLFGVIITIILLKICITGIDDAHQYFGGGRLAGIVDWILTIFMLTSYIVMVSGSGAAFTEQVGFPYWVGVLFMSVLCVWTFAYGSDGLVNVSTWFTPVLIVGIILSSLYIILTRIVPASTASSVASALNTLPVSSVLYVCYNVLTSVAVLTALQPLVTSRRVAYLAGIISTLALGGMGLMLWVILFTFSDKIAYFQIPMLLTTGRITFFYLIFLYIAMLTTAVSSGFGFIRKLQRTFNISHALGIFILFVLGITLGLVSFVKLVTRLYAFFGYIGVFVVAFILIDGFKSSIGKNARKSK